MSHNLNLLVLFTYGLTLDKWDKIGILSREISLYLKLIKKNMKISFLTYGSKEELKYLNKLEGISIKPCYDLIESKIKKIKLFNSLFLPIKLKKDLKSINIIKSNQLEGSWVSWLAKILYRKKLIIRGGFEWLKFHMLKRNTSNKGLGFRYWLIYFWRYFIEFISYKLADEIIITNPDDVNFIIEKFHLGKKRDRINLIYNFIDTNLFKPMSFKKKDKHVLFIGRFGYQKNLKNLLDAFANLKEFTLDMIGDGILKQYLEKKSRDLGIKINFLGKYPNEKIPEILNEYEIFILPSHYEGSPKVLLEAMSCGLVCIGTNVWGIKNIITHKKNGLLCDKDSNSIANAIKIVYENPILKKEIGENARNFILTNCSLEKIVEQEYKIYGKLLGY
ncbi:MAG: glycosyltransferase family 4 protein [Candidatus Hermodarchaeota archaeon]